jgi:hypothetical protein
MGLTLQGTPSRFDLLTQVRRGYRKRHTTKEANQICKLGIKFGKGLAKQMLDSESLSAIRHWGHQEHSL